ncbi:L,D-transpeptidase family protein [Shinella curvata]|uniref:L,D-transpeptidase family protein n=1 Tax=Shinella curvata TaxID=1817964 RepID=A0ABT8XH09_9HYPH|nr:L,D-transpeptidase family protein [Shinella curvata]MCJ8053690.1 L,D-transpeptidase family protein [Shinella curvata]MDO6123022.1 L,D-transpeptidase family protein [Shinella curvata]
MKFRLATGMSILGLLLSCGTALAGTLEGPLQIIVSKDLQELKIYDGDVVVATSHVSTGKAGHSTPTGIFSILEKKRTHFSNLYDSAPMPFMQRLTWSGIALHASNSVPSYPASHGCVRLPNDFAKTLFSVTRRGGHVLITDREIAPQEIVHAALFKPVVVVPDTPILSEAGLRPGLMEAGDKAVEVAMTDPKPEVLTPIVQKTEQDPIRILITRRGDREMMIDLQTLLTSLGYDAGVADGLHGKQTVIAIRAFQLAEGLNEDGMVTPELLTAVYAKAGKGAPPNGQILVRQKFKPLVEAAITIRNPEIALGTHFLLARDVDSDKGKADWFGMSVDNQLPSATMKRLGITTEADATQPDALTKTLDRLDIPADTRLRISELMGEGASLSISDTGLGPETGDGTDFITVTRKVQKADAGAVEGGKKSKKKKKSSVTVIN